jgi:hypothetical protein
MDRTRLLALVSVMTLAGASHATGEQRLKASDDVSAEAFFKNIQVLKGVPSSKLIGAMNFMAASLGVRCEHCHVTTETGNWPMEKDDKKAKRTAREMIAMVREINRANFNGRDEVTCATCHHGKVKPSTRPPLWSASAAAAESAVAPLEPGAPLPKLDEVLAKYRAAIGGEEAFSKLHSRELKGSIERAGAPPQSFVIEQLAPDKYRATFSLPDGSFTRGFDGRSGWNSMGKGASPMEAGELAETRLQADFRRDLDLPKEFDTFVVTGRVKVEERAAIEAIGRGPGGKRARIDFDAETGLVLRRTDETETLFGWIPVETSYSDYRIVDGVRFPFTVRKVSSRGEEIRRFSQVRNNLEIDPKIFAMPAQKGS